MQIRVEGMAQERIDTMGMYSGLFFVGILLGIVFVAGTVLIMYYKQITEGYEDQKRFEVLQKVGMTRREIKKSINSQILTVFFPAASDSRDSYRIRVSVCEKDPGLFLSEQYAAARVCDRGMLSHICGILRARLSGDFEGILPNRKRRGKGEGTVKKYCKAAWSAVSWLGFAVFRFILHAHIL